MLTEREPIYQIDDFVPTPEEEAEVEAELKRMPRELTEIELQAIFGDSDYFQLFKSDIRATRLLTAEEEVALAKSGDYDSLAFYNIRLVFRFAARYATRECHFADLAQEGFVGLMHAVHGYNPNLINPQTGQPYRFSTYAYRWIWYQTWAYAKKERAYTADLRLDAPAFKGSDEPLASFIADPAALTPEEELAYVDTVRELKRIVREEVNFLYKQAPNQARAIELSSGLVGDPQTNKQIAQEIGIRPGTVRTYQSLARDKLERSPRLKALVRL